MQQQNTDDSLEAALARIKELEKENAKLKKFKSKSLRRRINLRHKAVEAEAEVVQVVKEKRLLICNYEDEIKDLTDVFKRQQNELKEKLKEKEKEIQEINEKYDDLMERGRDEDHRTFKRLLDDFRDLIENWDRFDLNGIIAKLMAVKSRWGINLNDIQYIIIGHFAKASEKMVKDLKLKVLHISGNKTAGISDLISNLEKRGLFGKKCGWSCRGSCGKLECVRFVKDMMMQWKDQRNMMIHREYNYRWKSPLDLNKLVCNVEKIVGNCIMQVNGGNDFDNDNDSDDYGRVFGY